MHNGGSQIKNRFLAGHEIRSEYAVRAAVLEGRRENRWGMDHASFQNGQRRGSEGIHQPGLADVEKNLRTAKAGRWTKH